MEQLSANDLGVPLEQPGMRRDDVQVLRIDTQRPLSEEEAIAMARSEDAYPDLRTGVLEYAWEDASVYEVATTPVH